MSMHESQYGPQKNIVHRWLVVFLRTPVAAYDKLYHTILCDEKQKDLNMMLWYHVGSITILRTPGVCNIT